MKKHTMIQSDHCHNIATCRVDENIRKMPSGLDKLKEDFTDTAGFVLRRLRNRNQLLRSIKSLGSLKIIERIL